MPDYGDILRFLAANPPESEAARLMHASLLELLAEGLRSDEGGVTEPPSLCTARAQAA
jgi:hypothetical protein